MSPEQDLGVNVRSPPGAAEGDARPRRLLQFIRESTSQVVHFIRKFTPTMICLLNPFFPNS